MRIIYEGKSLNIDNQEFTFNNNIFQMKIDDRIYILLDIPSKSKLNYEDFS